MQEVIAGKLQAFLPLRNTMDLRTLNVKTFPFSCDIVELSMHQKNTLCQIAEVHLCKLQKYSYTCQLQPYRCIDTSTEYGQKETEISLTFYF